MDYKQVAIDIYQAALDSVPPQNAMQHAISLEEDSIQVNGDTYAINECDSVHLFASGKAALPMARYVESLLLDHLKDGLVISNVEGMLEKIPVVTGTHPIPTQKSVDAAAKMKEKLSSLGENDFFIYLLSGGSSALMELPMEPATLDDFQTTTKLLLASGAAIHEINCIRKHLSQVKGGKLSACTKAKGIILVISDVIGDDLDTIASGPFYPDPKTYQDASAIMDKYKMKDKLPASIASIMEKGLNGEIPDTPDSPNSRIKHYIISSNALALEAAHKKAQSCGFQSHKVKSDLEGEAKDVATLLVQEALSKQTSEPKCYLYGGETTVTLKGNGKGGRNQEMVLSALKNIANNPGIVFLSAGTDGIDGNSDAAGAVVDNTTYAQSQEKGLDIQAYLDNNDSYTFFSQTDSLIKPGPTGTNVMDITIVITH